MLFNNRATDKKKPRPHCQMCEDRPAAVDGKTKMGPWAYMCVTHHESHGVGLGMGVGQVLLCGDQYDDGFKIHYNLKDA